VNFTQREPLFRDFEFAEAEVFKLQKQQSMHQVSVERKNLISQCTAALIYLLFDSALHAA